MTVQVCEPLDWSHLGPDDADNPDVLEQCYREVETIMQQTLDALVEENPFPLARRLGKLLRKRPYRSPATNQRNPAMTDFERTRR